ncbi:hypothetical protein [Vallitalea maricola]|uniref:Uncharacterized protein n=1 Tax=Vallitalea maricola TaxID=3074433 RepID=A0ACB5UM28_9FIRM|nr:hypothetical protein AN2V17_27650 [Vallitalea sp. AN17-2]
MNDQLMKQMLLVNEIMRIALLVNNLSEHDIFTKYSGHVNVFECRIYENGWSKNADSTKEFEARLNSDDGGLSMLTTTINYLKELYMNIDITQLTQEGAECFV